MKIKLLSILLMLALVPSLAYGGWFSKKTKQSCPFSLESKTFSANKIKQTETKSCCLNKCYMEKKCAEKVKCNKKKKCSVKTKKN